MYVCTQNAFLSASLPVFCKHRSDSRIHLLLVVPSLIPPCPAMLPYALTRLQYQSIRPYLASKGLAYYSRPGLAWL